MSLPDIDFCRERWLEARPLNEEKVSHWEKSVTRPDNIDQIVLDRPVIDQTELAGRFDFELKWTPDRVNSADAAAPAGATIPRRHPTSSRPCSNHSGGN